MVCAFYDTSVTIDDETLDGKWTPAEANQILFRNFGNPEAAVRDLVSLSPHVFEDTSCYTVPQFQ